MKMSFRLELVPAFLVVAGLTLGGFAQHASAQSTVAQIWSGGAGAYNTYNLTVSEVISTAATTNTLVLQDSTGSILDYKIPTTTYAAPLNGDVITLTGITNDPYEGNAELSGTPTGFSLVSTDNPTPTYPVVTIPTFNSWGTESPLATGGVESMVTIDDVSFAAGTPATLSNSHSYTITDGTNTATIYTYASYTAVVAGTAQLNLLGGGNAPVMDLTGYVDPYYTSSPEFYVTSAVVAPEPASVAIVAIGCLALLKRRRPQQA
jgi:hypothetical protein